MFLFFAILGILLAAFGSIAVFMNLPVTPPGMPLKEAFSELFDNDKFIISVFCTVLGYLIVFFLMYCISSAY